MINLVGYSKILRTSVFQMHCLDWHLQKAWVVIFY